MTLSPIGPEDCIYHQLCRTLISRTIRAPLHLPCRTLRTWPNNSPDVLPVCDNSRSGRASVVKPADDFVGAVERGAVGFVGSGQSSGGRDGVEEERGELEAGDVIPKGRCGPVGEGRVAPAGSQGLDKGNGNGVKVWTYRWKSGGE